MAKPSSEVTNPVAITSNPIWLQRRPDLRRECERTAKAKAKARKLDRIESDADQQNRKRHKEASRRRRAVARAAKVDGCDVSLHDYLFTHLQQVIGAVPIKPEDGDKAEPENVSTSSVRSHPVESPSVLSTSPESVPSFIHVPVVTSADSNSPANHLSINSLAEKDEEEKCSHLDCEAAEKCQPPTTGKPANPRDVLSLECVNGSEENSPENSVIEYHEPSCAQEKDMLSLPKMRCSDWNAIGSPGSHSISVMEGIPRARSDLSVSPITPHPQLEDEADSCKNLAKERMPKAMRQILTCSSDGDCFVSNDSVRTSINCSGIPAVFSHTSVNEEEQIICEPTLLECLDIQICTENEEENIKTDREDLFNGAASKVAVDSCLTDDLLLPHRDHEDDTRGVPPRDSGSPSSYQKSMEYLDFPATPLNIQTDETIPLRGELSQQESIGGSSDSMRFALAYHTSHKLPSPVVSHDLTANDSLPDSDISDSTVTAYESLPDSDISDSDSTVTAYESMPDSDISNSTGNANLIPDSHPIEQFSSTPFFSNTMHSSIPKGSSDNSFVVESPFSTHLAQTSGESMNTSGNPAGCNDVSGKSPNKKLQNRNTPAQSVPKGLRKQRVYKCKECLSQFLSLKSHFLHPCEVLRRSRETCCLHPSEVIRRSSNLTWIKSVTSSVDEQTCQSWNLSGTHISSKHEDKKYQCATCGDCFGKDRYLDHLMVHLKPHKCETCSKSFVTKRKLDEHLTVHALECQSHKCETCSKSFVTKQKLDEHLKEHSSAKLSGKHISGRHKDQKYECATCGDCFKKESGYLDHLMVHLKPHKCETCSKSFVTKKKLDEHLTIHALECLSHECETCSKSFVTKQELDEHQTGHALECQSYECETCSKSLVTKQELDEHLTVHAFECQSYECETCSKLFVTKQELDEHQIVPALESKSHKCETCSKSFVIKHELNENLKVHPMECQVQFLDIKICSENGHENSQSDREDMLNKATSSTAVDSCQINDLMLPQRDHKDDSCCSPPCDSGPPSLLQKSMEYLDFPATPLNIQTGKTVLPQGELSEQGSVGASSDSMRFALAYHTSHKLPSPVVSYDLTARESLPDSNISDSEGNANLVSDGHPIEQFLTAPSISNTLIPKSSSDNSFVVESPFSTHLAQTSGDSMNSSGNSAGCNDVSGKSSNQKLQNENAPRQRVRKGPTKPRVFRCKECLSQFPTLKLRRLHPCEQLRGSNETSVTSSSLISAAKEMHEDAQTPGSSSRDELCSQSKPKKKYQRKPKTAIKKEIMADDQPFGQASFREQFQVSKTEPDDVTESRLSSDMPSVIPLTVPYQDSTFETAASSLSFVEVTLKPESPQPAFGYQCQKCGETFKTAKLSRAHLSSKHKEQKYQCATCGDCFEKESGYLDHLMVHPLECQSCGKTFKKRKSLSLHMKWHLDVKPHKCETCSKSFVTKQKLDEHMNTHTGNAPIKCKDCEETFKRYSNLIQHRNSHHLNLKRKTRDFICHCGEVYQSKKKLEWHKEIHNDKPKSCQYCSEKFLHTVSLTRHVRRAHDRRYVPKKGREGENIECPVCNLVFMKSSLATHLKIHNAERLFSCHICGRDFSTKWNLQLHRWTHASRSSKPFKCTLCKAAFFRKQDFQGHMHSHRNVRPFTCNHCGCQFIRKYNCLRHMREHEEGKNFACTICNKHFHRSYYLKDHMRVHSGSRPFSCHICGKASTCKSNHNKHVRIHHAREPQNTEV